MSSFISTLQKPQATKAQSSLWSHKSPIAPRHGRLLAPRKRCFHVSPRAQIDMGTITQTGHYIFTEIHSLTGLPWGLTIPFIAVTIRASIMLPLAIYGRHVTSTQRELSPLVSAWSQEIMRQKSAVHGHQSAARVKSATLRAIRKKRSEIYKRWKCQLWKLMMPPFLYIPVWLSAMATLRSMCGQAHAWNFAWLPWVSSDITTEDDVGAQGQSEVGTSSTYAGGIDAVSVVEVDTSAAAPSIAQKLLIESAEFEPSLAHSGILWFPDLLAPDPQLILPFALSGAIYLTVSGWTPFAISELPDQVGKSRKRLINTMKIVALAVGPMTLQVPSGILLFGVSSASFAVLQSWILPVMWPSKRAITPATGKALDGALMES